jgi:hypothetical protein
MIMSNRVSDVRSTESVMPGFDIGCAVLPDTLSRLVRGCYQTAAD